jgi:hypothetical protein
LETCIKIPLDTADDSSNHEKIAAARKAVRAEVGKLTGAAKCTPEVNAALQTIWDAACGTFDGFLFAHAIVKPDPDKPTNSQEDSVVASGTMALGHEGFFLAPLAKFIIRNGLEHTFIAMMVKETLDAPGSIANN